MTSCFSREEAFRHCGERSDAAIFSALILYVEDCHGSYGPRNDRRLWKERLKVFN